MCESDRVSSEDCRILYVDDEAPNLVVFESAFGEEFSILCAPSAEVALELLDRFPIGVLITDQRMPGMTGIDLCEKCREWHPDVIRVLLTAYSDQQTAIDAINRGGLHRYVTKPWGHWEMRQMLNECVARVRLERTVRTLRQTIADREQVVAMSFIRARVLFDLANVTTTLLLTSGNIDHNLRSAEKHLPPELAEATRAELDELRLALRYLVELHEKTRTIVSRPQPQFHRARELLDGAVELVRAEVSRTARIITDCPEDLQIWADRTDVTRILLNLIQNSRESIEASGRRDGEIRVQITEKDGAVEILVSDNGPGVPTDLQPRVFDPEGMAARPAGTGLGLPISRQLAFMNRGDITLTPTGPLPGANFRLILPAHPEVPDGGGRRAG
jgi:signal transduction histidine kinase